MSRYQQRKRVKMQNPEYVAAYQEARAEIALQHALDQVRQRRELTKEELAQRMGLHREAVSRLLISEQSNPTLGSVTSLLLGLDVTADIELRPRKEGEAPINVAISKDVTPFTFEATRPSVPTDRIDLTFDAPTTAVQIALNVDKGSRTEQIGRFIGRPRMSIPAAA